MTSTGDRLADSTFDSLDGMMQAYAKEAVRVAASEHGVNLDYSPGSIEALEGILSKLAPVQESGLERLTKLWGSYFGEVFRRRYASEWTMSAYPGGKFAVPTLEIGGSRIYPLMKVHRRLTMGAPESLVTFQQMVEKRLEQKLPQFN
jgi:hypothetical protein